jgi:hypothetical protein
VIRRAALRIDAENIADARVDLDAIDKIAAKKIADQFTALGVAP